MHAVSTSICDKVLVLHARKPPPKVEEVKKPLPPRAQQYASEQARYVELERARVEFEAQRARAEKAQADAAAAMEVDGGYGCQVTELARAPDEDSGDFYLRVQRWMQQAEADSCACPNFEDLAQHIAGSDDVLVFGGELEDYDEVAKAVIPAAKKAGFGGKLSVVNLRGADRRKKVYKVQVEGQDIEVVSVVGWDVLDYLACM
jgi:hypothetical protein